ncbi:MAG: hypothetical protein J6U34_03870, partial [Bacteroidales bacterium]|nr:hypothetical protein [Bacteroidales bacterium]
MKILRFIISFASVLALSCLSAAQAQNLRDSVQVVADSVVTALPKAAVADADTSATPASVDSVGLPVIDPGLSEFVPDPIDSLPVVKSTLERPAFSS